ncbi:MAG: 4-hydroxy-tetrahydrodipicolinate synthase [Kiritimatiellae bacterium]|jgi:4-hydroxy-tetrahydrodipicolinate synthase|nr:4-hydroxy-tetrahydrodipicolinate synthase [Kiritimatiellia bacterium]
MNFQGAYTALVTPFNNDGSVDFGKFKELIEIQIAGNIDGIVPVGTTGESPTLLNDEHSEVVKKAVEYAGGKIKVIAGAGANSTTEAIELTKRAIGDGVDGTLQVTPYYNKPTQEGLYRHFYTIADQGGKVMLYNVPGRSGLPIKIETVVRLAEHPNIVSVKEAAGSVERVSKIKSACDIEVISGDDTLTLPMMSVGAVGVVSVASNIIPAVISKLVHSVMDGDFVKAKKLHYEYYKFFKALFLETNPIGIKAAMSYAEMINEVYRLPMCELSFENSKILKNIMIDIGIISEPMYNRG